MANGAAVDADNGTTTDESTTLADDLRASLPEDDSVEHVDIAISGESTAGSESATTQTAGADAVVSQETAAPTSPILERLRQHGLDVPVQDDAAIADYVATTLREAQQARQWVEQNRQQIAQWQQYAQQLQSQQQAAQEQAKPQRPKLDPAWVQYRELGEDGKERWTADTPHEVKQSWAAYQAHRQNYVQQLIDDPAAALESVFAEREARLMQQFEQRYAQQAQQAQQQQVEQAWIQQNQNWLFQQANGQPIRTQTGQLVPTPEGARVTQYFQHYAQYMPAAEAAEVAKQKVFNELAMPLLMQQQTTPVEQAAQADLNLLKNGAKRSVGRANSVRNGAGANAPLQNEHASFAEIFQHEAQAQGVDLSQWN